MEFKDRLRELRGKRTQKEIAKLLGVPLNSYNNWENGREPSYAVLKKIAEFYHVTVDYLVGYEDNHTPDTNRLTECYGLSDNALYALDRLHNNTMNDYSGNGTMKLLNDMLESELLSHKHMEDILKDMLVDRSAPRLPEKPTQMLSELANKIIEAIDKTNQIYQYVNNSGSQDILYNACEGIIYKYSHDIARIAEYWLRYYCNPDVIKEQQEDDYVDL